MPRKIQRYGWIPSLPDPRDRIFSASRLGASPLPDVVDLRTTGFLPPVYDQGDIGSCTANSIAAAVAYEHARQGLGSILPSRLFIYANERIMEGTPLSNDSGAQIRDGVKSVAQQGVCPESEWPYVPANFSVQPPSPCYTDAKKELALEYQSVGDGQIISALAQGNPAIVGITVFQSFEETPVATSGVVEMPQPWEGSVGGHAVLIVGYDLNARTYLVRNSWGPSWGQQGHFTLPFDYLSQYGADFWVIQKVS